MSHFSVLVISNDLEETLAPFNEQDEEFATPHDTTENYLADYERMKANEEYASQNDISTFAKFISEWNGYDVVDNEDDAEECEESHHGYALVDKDGNCIKCVGFWNDDAKWDYWNEARNSWARCSYDNIIFKNPKFDPKTETITVKDIDVDAMVAKALRERGEAWDKVNEFFGGEMPTIITWETIYNETIEKVEALDLTTDEGKAMKDTLWDEARKKYHSQEAVDKFNKRDEKGGFLGNLDNYLKPREEYVDEATLPFYSIVTDYGWFERAKMGWWGVTYDETMTKKEWREKQIALFNEADADTEVHMVDCHI